MIHKGTPLREVAFEVCTALWNAGVRVVLTGGSAATIYAPDAHQSEDLDFIIQFDQQRGPKAVRALEELGYTEEGGSYRHQENPLTLDFPPGPLMVGGDLIQVDETLHENSMVLFVLTPTDSCRDRLAAFLHWGDWAGLEQALAVARAQRERIDLELIRAWCGREGNPEAYAEFERRMRGSDRT